MERDKVRAILRTLHDEHIRYAIVGAVAVGYYSTPRATPDIDVLMHREDIPRVQRLFRQHYPRGTAVVMMPDIDGTRLDVLPANLRLKRLAVDNAIDVMVDGVAAKVVSLRDLLLLKLLAIPARPELAKRRQDEADVTALLGDNAEKISREDIRYIVGNLPELVFSQEDARRYQELLHWLNETLELLGMTDRQYRQGCEDLLPLDPMNPQQMRGSCSPLNISTMR